MVLKKLQINNEIGFQASRQPAQPNIPVRNEVMDSERKYVKQN
jgi:hypothetical protein